MKSAKPSDCKKILMQLDETKSNICASPSPIILYDFILQSLIMHVKKSNDYFISIVGNVLIAILMNQIDDKNQQISIRWKMVEFSFRKLNALKISM